MPGIPLLENTSNIGLILFILQNEGCTRQQVYDGYKRNALMPQRIDSLVDAGVLYSTEGAGSRNRNSRLFLTERGREIALMLRRISELLPDGERRTVQNGSDRTGCGRSLLSVVRIRSACPSTPRGAPQPSSPYRRGCTSSLCRASAGRSAPTPRGRPASWEWTGCGTRRCRCRSACTRRAP